MGRPLICGGERAKPFAPWTELRWFCFLSVLHRLRRPSGHETGLVRSVPTTAVNQRGRVPQVPPDFLLRLVALTNFMRLSSLKAAHMAVGWCSVQEIRVLRAFCEAWDPRMPRIPPFAKNAKDGAINGAPGLCCHFAACAWPAVPRGRPRKAPKKFALHPITRASNRLRLSVRVAGKTRIRIGKALTFSSRGKRMPR